LRPASATAKVSANPCNRERLASECYGKHTGGRPLVRPRPASDVTVMLRNPVIRDGYVSSEPIGSHTGFAPRKTDDARLRNTLPTRTCRPRSAPSWTRTARVSDAIGWHPRPETPDVNDTAAMHFEAQFAHRFGEAGHLGAVLSTKGTGAAAEFQKRFIERAAAMQPTNEFEFDETEGKTVRDDGQLMEKMEFDTIYSNRFSEKASESAFGRDLVPVIDLRRDALTRPKQLGYGKVHLIQTANGMRQPLPTRSTVGIGTGRGRSIDF